MSDFTQEFLEKVQEGAAAPYYKVSPYTDRDLIELACRAPACPEWFEPDMAGFDHLAPSEEILGCLKACNCGNAFCGKHDWRDPKSWPKWYGSNRYSLAYEREKAIQWPKAYARMVLESK